MINVLNQLAGFLFRMNGNNAQAASWIVVVQVPLSVAEVSACKHIVVVHGAR